MLQKLIRLILSLFTYRPKPTPQPLPQATPTFTLCLEDEQKLTELYPPFAAIVRQLITKAHEQGMEVRIFEGLRTMGRQKELYAEGRDETGNVVDRSKVVTDAPPGHSAHQYGAAVDLVFSSAASGQPWQWSWAPSHPWKQLAELSKSLGLDAGYLWVKFPDIPHSEFLYGFLCENLLPIYNQGGMAAVWKKFDESQKKPQSV
jgi:peptidoglycan L-alanyl-D-glutamate endopeptidase CwlK